MTDLKDADRPDLFADHAVDYTTLTTVEVGCGVCRRRI
jgi:hypothetical protein